jgi:hypothetical protein
MSTPGHPLVTVISAVWHRQRDKLDLLRGHMRNLAAQTVPVLPIYVFDGGDSAPDWLTGLKICVSERLTIYEAWNLALAATRTPFVANLNLDDRFAPDALARMVAALDQDPEAYLVGGDWLICHTETETDAVVPMRDAPSIPAISRWPPGPEGGHRLGSGGDTSQGTMGPACLWRMAAHLQVPRYPYRFADGTPIRVIADSVWWNLIRNHMKKRLVRLPFVIGHYRTWPEEQAEFRHSATEEHGKQQISLL